MTALACGAAGAGALAILELDAASVGPFLLSRPFVVGPLVGWACGDPWTGAAFGAVFEALTLEELPLGGRLDFSAPLAAGVAAVLASAPGGLAPEAAFLAGLAAGWAHARLEVFLRRGRGVRARRVETRLAAGAAPRLGAEIAAALALQAAATFGLALAAAVAVGPALTKAWPVLPEFLRAGARAAFFAAPWIGAGSLAASLARRA
jgi:mannose/fructose/N-acetylgalactosamine-specific phosphotransferase system component IIC